MMFRLITSICLIVLVESVCAQDKNVAIPTYLNGDTSLWYKWRYDLSKEIGIPRLIFSDKPFYFRLWIGGNVVDLWSDRDGSYSGQVTCWARKVGTKRRKPFSKTYALEKTVTDQLVGLLNEKEILSIPIQDSISGWLDGEDGITYLFEFSSSTDYSFKEYWTPNAQNGIREAEVIQEFVDRVEDLAEVATFKKLFYSKLPVGCYSTGGMVLTCKQKK